jgi:type VI secretion system protein ImpL
MNFSGLPLGLLRNQKFIAGAGCIVVIMLIFFLGPRFGLTFTVRIILAVVVVLIWIIVVLILKMRAERKAGQIENSIHDQGDQQINSLSPEKQAEIKQFRKQLEDAITSLKNSKLGKGRSGKSALYALPWYMVIGPSATGKTTAIRNSGLEFPFGDEGFRGVGGTRNCDWFFSNQAIFLDTAGRYTTQIEDREEWFAFLEVLKKNRKYKPVNGVLVCLSIDTIIKSENEEMEIANSEGVAATRVELADVSSMTARVNVSDEDGRAAFSKKGKDYKERHYCVIIDAHI